MSVDLREATTDDAPLLAQMNHQLIADEGSPNTMSLEELETRMREWLEGDRKAVIIQRKDDIVGYIVYRRLNDEYFPYDDSIYVRQYFIKASYRRRGIGQVAFNQIAEAYFPSDCAIMLDVLETNPEGKHFWSKIGFSAYNVTMRRDP